MVRISDVLQPVSRKRSRLSFARSRRATMIDLRPPIRGGGHGGAARRNRRLLLG